MYLETWPNFSSTIKTLVPLLTNGTKKTILGQIPLHGDQLFEEQARNVIWTYRDGIDDYERLEGIGTEFADWYAKFTLYKVKIITILLGYYIDSMLTACLIIPVNSTSFKKKNN